MPKRIHVVLKSHHGALKMLSKAKGRRFSVILNNTPDITKALKVLFRYVLNGTLKLEDKHVKKLKPHRNFVRKVADGTHTTIKRHAQKGGNILKSILNTVLPLLPMLL